MHKTIFLVVAATIAQTAAQTAAAQSADDFIWSIDMLNGCSSTCGATQDRESRTLTIQKPGNLPPMSENSPHTVGPAEIGLRTGPAGFGSPIGR